MVKLTDRQLDMGNSAKFNSRAAPRRLRAPGLGGREIDVAEGVESHVFRAMASHRGQPHVLKETAQQIGIGRCVFDEFESVGAHGIDDGHEHLKESDALFQHSVGVILREAFQPLQQSANIALRRVH